MQRAMLTALSLVVVVFGCSSAADRSGRSQSNANGSSNAPNGQSPNGSDDSTGDPSGDNSEGPTDQDAGPPSNDAGSSDAGGGGDCTFNASAGAMTASHGWHDVASLTTVGLQDTRFRPMVWTGHEVIAFGVFQDAVTNADVGATLSYDPIGNTWKRLPDSPLGVRFTEYLAMAGRNKFVVWGGSGSGSSYNLDGAVFDLCTKSWSKIPDAPIVGRANGPYGWISATNELVIWGGNRSSIPTSDPHKGPGGEQADGAAYSLTTGTWRMISSPTTTFSPMFSAFYDSTTTDGQLVIYGGGPNHGGGPSAGLAFSWDAATDVWTKLPAPSIQGRQFAGEQPPVKVGDSVFFFGGHSVGQPLPVPGDGAILDLKTSTWTSIPAPTADVLPSPLRDAQGYFVLGGKLYAWGGWAVGGGAPAAGAVYDPSTGTWSSMPAGGPAFDSAVAAVTMNGAALVWGTTSKVFVQ